MSSVHIPRVLTQRGKSSLEIERENFEKTQTASIQKAINTQETPAKEKHVRVAILGTHTEQSCSMYWSVATRLPLQGNPIVCWKFCHVTHKMLRDGHPNVLKDSQRYAGLLVDLGKLWRHLKEGYGRLIAYYTKLLLQKFAFHKKNPDIPGNLMMEDEELNRICQHDVNNYFELSVDMLDYMDDILALQERVFGSLDMSRSNSMTSSGQCRLAPLILCIQDSCQLYDYIVKILFKLHSSLPPDTLGGHRDRFNHQYRSLKAFYTNSSNLQYYKNLIKVPSLPQDPPNFLRASDLHSHVKPVAVVPEPECLEAETPDADSFTDSLIDTSSVCSEPSIFEDAFSSPFQNGAPSPPPPPPPMPDDRDCLISQLMQEVNELRQDLARVKAEDHAVIESLNNRLKELDMEIMELRQIAESTTEENEALRGALKEGEKNEDAANKLVAIGRTAKVNEERFKKMKTIYAELREEHVKLLRQDADVKKQLATLTQEKEEAITKCKFTEQELHVLKQDRQSLEVSLEQSSANSSMQFAVATSDKQRLEDEKHRLASQLAEVEDARRSLENALDEAKLKSEALKQDLRNSTDEHLSAKELLQKQMSQHRLNLLVCAVEEGQSIIRDSIEQVDNPHHSTMTCTAEYLLNRTQPVLNSLHGLKSSCQKYETDKDEVGDVIKSVCDFSHRMGECILLGFATAHAAQIEPGEELITQCKLSGEEGILLLGLIKQELLNVMGDQECKVEEAMQRLIAMAEQLLPKVEDVKAEEMGDMVEGEMMETSLAIEKAAAKIAEMLSQSRETHSGIQLEVNERILDSCNGLMLAIKVLVEKAKSLQKEIVVDSKGTSSAKDFYKKHHRWTEGLISAAKAVGWGANVLVDAADKVVRGEGKFEDLVVCSQEIAASTTQLVVSSKVKSPRGSQNLHQLAEASKGVTTATGQVVASAKAGAKLSDDLDTLDFSKLTLHQCKRLEMDCQVRTLELESDLEKERKKLMELRRNHYQLAGESEGWEQEDIDGIESNA